MLQMLHGGVEEAKIQNNLPHLCIHYIQINSLHYCFISLTCLNMTEVFVKMDAAQLNISDKQLTSVNMNTTLPSEAVINPLGRLGHPMTNALYFLCRTLFSVPSCLQTNAPGKEKN